jgi:F0F1-type ATP synthase delta subunit
MSTKTARTVAERFLTYLKEEGLNDQLQDIAEHLTKEADRRHTITVICATPLSDKEQKDLSATLTAEWGDRDVMFTVDESLLSGMIISFRDRVIDMSGRHALRDLRQELS